MNDRSAPQVSRRQLLAGASAASVAVLLSGGRGAAAAPRSVVAPLAAGEAVVAFHDRSHADYQNQWNTLVAQGFRPISLCVYGDPAQPLYAGVWVQRAGPAFAGIHGATAAQFQTFFDTWAARGYSPVLLSATGPASNPVFASVMELSSSGVSLTRHVLRTGSDTDPGTIDYWLAQAKPNNWIPRCIAPYGTPADRRFAIVLDPNPTHELWSAAGWTGENATDYQNRFTAHTQQWVRPAIVSVGPDPSYTSVFRADLIGSFVARHNLTSAGYQAEYNTWVPRGYYPISVQAGGPANNIRFAVLFATRDIRAARAYTATGTAVPAFAAVDAKVRAFMRDTGIRGVGVAITRGGRLVHARGYTWAEAGYPLTQPSTMFRIASCSKPITSIAIHQLIQAGKLRLDTTLQSVLNLQPAPGTTLDPNFGSITVQHLLTHTAGFGDIPNVAAVAQAFGQNLPVSKLQMARFQAGQPLHFQPGTQPEYSNLGYLLLGLIVEQRRGLAYPTAVQRYEFSRLGLTRPHRSATLQSQQRAGDARQHDTDLRLWPSAVSGPATGARPVVPLTYGGEDLALYDSFGGWSMAPADYAKVLAAFAIGNSNPLLHPDTVQTMWTPSAVFPGYTNGWSTWTEPNGVRGFQHFGAMPGVSTRILYREDGWGYAIFGNGGMPDIYPELANLPPGQWPAHDLFPSVGIPAFPAGTTSFTATGQAPGDHRPAGFRGATIAGD